jgi:CHAT domain-containing protein
LQREALATLELTPNRQLIPTARLNLAAAAIRAGSIPEAEEAMRTAELELAANGGGRSVHSILAEVETAMANVYLDRGELAKASEKLDAAYAHMAGARTGIYLRNYAVARGQLALEQGRAEAAEPLLREAIVAQEQAAGAGSAASTVQAEQNRELYATLAGVWLAEGRPGGQILALWERYRLRILGVPVLPCPDHELDCLEPRLNHALERSGPARNGLVGPGLGRVLGQLVLPDRLLLYEADAQGVRWTQVPVHRNEVLAAADNLERAVNSPATPMDTVDRAARRVGRLLIDPFDGDRPTAAAAGPPVRLVLEPDPLLGNLPWPAVAVVGGDLGLRSDLEESPSILLEGRAVGSDALRGRVLVVGASLASGESQMLPEVLEEARAVARFDSRSTLLVGDQATEPEVAAQLGTAAAIHFAGHAANRDGATRLLLAEAKSAGGSSSATPWLDSALLRSHPPRRARLAVFSACSSGKKGQGWNHGMDDIVATLAALGVPDVVATRWQIDSGAAVPMMDAFYGGLSKGMNVPQALTEARQSMVRDPRYRHPYFWAAWYASGMGRADLSPIFHAGS